MRRKKTYMLIATSKLLQIKELESQLLVERKIARQHVDNKIAQDHLQKQHGMKEENNSYLRSPMAERNLNSTAEKAAATPKGLCISKQMFSDSNTDAYSFKQLMSLGEEEEKENNPEAAAQLPAPSTKARRVSLGNGGGYQQPLKPISRRTSLIPLPRHNSLLSIAAAAAAAVSPLDRITENLSSRSPSPCSPPVVSVDKGSRSRRVSSLLRRSLQKKVVIRPSVAAQAAKKAGAAAPAAQGTDSSARRAARRVPASGGGVGGQKVRQQNRDKERGWNNGTSLRNF
jgi:kinesin family member C2/C3